WADEKQVAVGPKHERKLIWVDEKQAVVGPKHEMKSIWADEKQAAVGPKHEKKPIWADGQRAAVGPKHEKRLIWADEQRKAVDPKHERKPIWADRERAASDPKYKSEQEMGNMKRKIKVMLTTCALMLMLLMLAGCTGKTQGGENTAGANNTAETESGDTKEQQTDEQLAVDNQNEDSDMDNQDSEESEKTESDRENPNDWSEIAKESLVALQQDLKTDQVILGVFFLGWEGEYSESTKENVLQGAGEFYYEYEFMREIEQCPYIEQPGEEVYLLIPACEDDEISVFEQVWGDDTDDGMPKRGKLLFAGKPGEVILVRGNESDIVSNLEISVTGDHEEMIYHPFLSLENGRLDVSNPDILDLTCYEEEGTDNDFAWWSGVVDVCYERLTNIPLIRKQIEEDGMVLMYDDSRVTILGVDCPVFSLCTDHEENYVAEKYYAVDPKGDVYYYDAIGDAWITDLE
ncbi:MAG: hypothetical protein ACI4DK_10860, partial [Lachnospiraceae bacterium]